MRGGTKRDGASLRYVKLVPTATRDISDWREMETRSRRAKSTVR